MRMSLPLSVIFFESIRNIFYLEHLNSRGFLLEPPDMVWSEDSTADHASLDDEGLCVFFLLL